MPTPAEHRAQLRQALVEPVMYGCDCGEIDHAKRPCKPLYVPPAVDARARSREQE